MVDLTKQFSIFNENHFAETAFYTLQNSRYLSYGEMNQQIIHISQLLIKNLSHPGGQKILLFLESGVDFIIGLFSIVLSQNIPVLLNNQLKTELESLKELTLTVLTDEKNLHHLKQYINIDDWTVIDINSLKKHVDYKLSLASSKLHLEYNPDDCFLYLFTSGSTGLPKLVPKTFMNLFSEVEYLKELLQVQPQDSFLPLVPSFHIYGLLFTVLLPLSSASRICLDIPFSPKSLLEDGMSNHCQYSIGNPVHYSSLLPFVHQYKKENFNKLKYAITSTMNLDPTIAKQLKDGLGISILELYGSSETGGIAYREFSKNPFWTFFPHVKHKIDKRDHTLHISSPSLSLPENQKENHRNNWYGTGDVIEDNPEQKGFVLLGRVNQIAKIGGNRVSTLEVEKVIQKLPYVKDVVVIKENVSSLGGEILVAYLVAFSEKLNKKEIIQKVKQHCRQDLADFKIPKYFRFLDQIPRGTNHKVQFHLLPKTDFSND